MIFFTCSEIYYKYFEQLMLLYCIVKQKSYVPNNNFADVTETYKKIIINRESRNLDFLKCSGP
jgi:hypothetical protein